MTDSISASEHRRLIDVAAGRQAPSTVICTKHLFNTYSGQVGPANIWISGNYVAYVGAELPVKTKETAWFRLPETTVAVPAYIEPHAHPFQLYNPFTLGRYLSEKGTLTSINDNRPLLGLTDEAQQDAFVQALQTCGGHTWLWWAYFEEGLPPSSAAFSRWLGRSNVVQGGEFSNWQRFKQASDELTERLYAVRAAGKRMEGHLPGASQRTLNLFASAGVSADHEALSADEVIHRLNLGYWTALRYSSIRRDLPTILRQLAAYPSIDWSKLMLTSDGASLPFLTEATPAELIAIAMDCGIAPAAAYRMATVNPAVYYRIDHLAGCIAPGRLANINVLASLADPRPQRVMFKGQWLEEIPAVPFHTARFFQPPVLTGLPETLPALAPVRLGLTLINAVITASYACDPSAPLADDESLLYYFNVRARRCLLTRIRGLAPKIDALVSTYCLSGDNVLVIGRNRARMEVLLQRARSGFLGLAAEHRDGSMCTLPLPVLGTMSDEPIERLTRAAGEWEQFLRRGGYSFNDPFFTLLFLTAVHLPAVRLTAAGMRDVRSGRLLALSVPF
ncbi:MAG: adenine deaminase C-terminal domain-containing protein [Sporolactobacillus sp.]